MITKFVTLLSFLLIFCMIGCGEDSASIVKPEAQSVASPMVFENVLISENVRAAAQPLPSKVEAVAAAPPLLLAPVVVPIISCGAAVVDVANLLSLTPQFLRNNSLFVGILSLPCPVDKPIKAIKGIKVLKNANTLRNIKFGKFTPANFPKNFGALKARAVREGYEIHHTIPQKFRARAKELGINIDQPWFGVEVSPRYHRQITKRYEIDWDKFFKQENLTQSDVLLFRQEMIKKYGLKSGSYLDVIK